MLYARFASPSWGTNAVFGVLALLGGVAFLAFPQLAVMILAGTVGLNLLLLGGSLVATAFEQRQREQLRGHAHAQAPAGWVHARAPAQGRRVHPAEVVFEPTWRGRVLR